MNNFSSYHAQKVKFLTLKAKNRNKSAILKKISAIIELVRELVTSNMHIKIWEGYMKNFSSYRAHK